MTACGTGWFFSDWGQPPDDPDRVGTTTVNFADPRAADVTRMRYAIRFTAGAGHMVILEPSGFGAVLLTPLNCLAFDVTGSFVFINA
jgi:hypothetical protein